MWQRTRRPGRAVAVLETSLGRDFSRLGPRGRLLDPRPAESVLELGRPRTGCFEPCPGRCPGPSPRPEATTATFCSSGRRRAPCAALLSAALRRPDSSALVAGPPVTSTRSSLRRAGTETRQSSSWSFCLCVFLKGELSVSRVRPSQPLAVGGEVGGSRRSVRDSEDGIGETEGREGGHSKCRAAQQEKGVWSKGRSQRTSRTGAPEGLLR